MLHQEFQFAGGDGLGLYAQGWLPGTEHGQSQAVVVWVHGFLEHGGRYAATAEALVRRGYSVYAMDLRGHGRSDGPRCLVDRFERYLEDLDVWIEAVGRREPAKPRFLLGHSMGGLVVALWSVTRRPPLAGLVMSASTLRLNADLFPVLRRLAGPVGRWLPWLRVARMGFRSMSRDRAVLAAWQADPLVFHGRFPARTGAELLRAMRWLEGSADAVLPPLLLLHGTADRLCEAEGSREFYRRAGSPDKTLRLYEGLYHDIFHEPEHPRVLADLAGWLDARR